MHRGLDEVAFYCSICERREKRCGQTQNLLNLSINYHGVARVISVPFYVLILTVARPKSLTIITEFVMGYYTMSTVSDDYPTRV